MANMPERIYTPAEKAKRARLLLKGARNAYGDTSAIERQIDRIDEKAEERARMVAAETARAEKEAARLLAAAKADARTVRQRGRAAAIKAKADAKVQQRAAQAAAKVNKPSSWW
jgi:hypothetical protein